MSRKYLAVLRQVLAMAAFLGAISATTWMKAADPLPSWNESPSRRAIIEFVEKVTNQHARTFVPVGQRIATFDNDGTLWAEKPMYFQLLFAIDRVQALASEHPEWKHEEPFASLLAGDVSQALAGGEQSALKIVMATHAGMTTDEFERIVKAWLATARHPRTKRPYIEMVYQPMLEVLNYLRENEFKTYIVSGGGVEFMRPWTEPVYGIPPEQVVGSRIKTRFEMQAGGPVLIRLPEIDSIDDKAGKPVGINAYIGRRPIVAFGNSDGDLEMLEWTTIPHPGSPDDATPRLGVLVHHTDAKREYAYDAPSAVGQLKRAIEEAPQRGWVIIDMRRDWKTIFPPARQSP